MSWLWFKGSEMEFFKFTKFPWMFLACSNIIRRQCLERYIAGILLRCRFTFFAQIIHTL